MQTKTKNATAWMILGVSLVGAAWVGFDIWNRYQSLFSQDQEISFGSNALQLTSYSNLSLDEAVSAHIFGVVPVEPKKIEAPKVVNAPETKLNLKLTGLMAGKTPSGGYAMVEIGRGETTIVSVGNEIGKTGASLHAVEADHILIEHKNRIEKLNLEREALGTEVIDESVQNTVKQFNLSQSELAVLTEIGSSESSSELQSGVQAFTVGVPAKIEEIEVADEGFDELEEEEFDDEEFDEEAEDIQ